MWIAVVAITVILGFIVYLLRNQHKSGRDENEIKQWREHVEILETMRKAHNEVDAMPMDDIIDIVRRHEKP